MIARREPPFVVHAACFEQGDELFVASECAVVLFATGDPEEFHFRICACGIVERWFDLVFIRRPAETADPGKAVGVRQSDAQRLPTAHAQPGDGALLTLG